MGFLVEKEPSLKIWGFDFFIDFLGFRLPFAPTTQFSDKRMCFCKWVFFTFWSFCYWCFKAQQLQLSSFPFLLGFINDLLEDGGFNLQMRLIWGVWTVGLGDGESKLVVEEEIFWEKSWRDWKLWICLFPFWKILWWSGNILYCSLWHVGFEIPHYKKNPCVAQMFQLLLVSGL